MNSSVKIVPQIPLSKWHRPESPEKTEEQILKAIIKHRDPLNERYLFNSSLKDIPNPYLLKDIEAAVALFISTIKTKGKILIVGDYDVDGITSTVTLVRFLKKIGFYNHRYFIPNRFSHGYGLTEKTLGIILDEKPSLVITVDTGVTAQKEVEEIRRRGIDVIITDHHQPQKNNLPDCLIINPKQPDCGYPCKQISGVGVIFLFIMVLRAELRKVGFWRFSQQEPNLLEDLDLVALGTIADQVPLLALNRLFAKFGIEQMTRRIHESSPGSFFYYLKIFAERKKIKSFNPKVIAFYLAPLLNAAGRMEDAVEGVRFLLAENEKEARECYSFIEQLNNKRRKKQEVMIRKASKQACSLIADQKGLFIYDESFHEGLIGIIANRLVDRFGMPAVVATDGTEGTLKASCRSKNENILEILEKCKPYLEHFGGHANAAGFGLKKENLEAFHQRFTDVCPNLGEAKTRVVKADIEIKPEMITYSLIERLKILEPYGHDNKQPVLMFSKFPLPEPALLAGKHLKWSFKNNFELILWNTKHRDVPLDSNCDIAFTLDKNIYRGEVKKQLIIQSVAANDSPSQENPS